MLSLLRLLPGTLFLVATTLALVGTSSAGVVITVDDDSTSWPEPGTGNIMGIAGPPKIEIVPDSSGLPLNFESFDISNNKVASQTFMPTTDFKLGSIAIYADGAGTWNTGTPDPDDHLPLTVHLFELVDGASGAMTLPGSYTLSTAGPENRETTSLFGGGSGLPLQWDGVPGFEYRFVGVNVTGDDQVQLFADRVYAVEIWGNSLVNAFNPQRLASGGSTNTYPDGSGYSAATTVLATSRTNTNRDFFMAFYEAAPSQPGDFNGDGNVDGLDFVIWQDNFPMTSGATLAIGDSDGDGDVDGADFVVWQTNYPFPSTPPSTPGDFDSDGDVDGVDFVAWQDNFPMSSGAGLADGDADGDGDVDGADFIIWQTNYPFNAGPASSPVPEPAGFALALCAALGFYWHRHDELASKTVKTAADS